MASLGLAVLGGALEGYGNAEKDHAVALRDQRFREMGWAHDEKMAQADRDFRSSEADKGRAFDLSMRDRTEKFEAGQNELNREATREARRETFGHEDTSREDTQAFTGDENEKERTARKGLQADSQEFQGSESQKDRDARRLEADTDRTFQRDEKAKDRAADKEARDKQLAWGANVVTASDGTSFVEDLDANGKKIMRPLTDAEGKAVKILNTKDKSADVTTAEWLVQNGAAANAEEAYAMVKQTASDRKSVRQAIFTKAMDALTKGAFGQVDPAELQKNAIEFTDQAMKYLEAEAGKSPTARGGMGTEDATAPAASDATSEVPMAPADPAKRTINSVYRNQKGQRAKWTEKGWQLVE